MKREEVQQDPRLASLVRRYHTWQVLQPQSVGEHSHQVQRLYCRLFGLPRAEVLYYITHHDLGEVQTGDPPYPIKLNNPALKAEMDRLEDVALTSMGIELPELTPAEKVLFKFCDLLDCIEYAKNEITMGNRYMIPVFELGAALATYMVKMEPEDQIAAALHCAKLGVGLGHEDVNQLHYLALTTYINNFKEPWQ